MAIDYWKQGGLVTVSAHLYNPANPKGGGLRDKGVDLKQLLKPGTETHDALDEGTGPHGRRPARNSRTPAWWSSGGRSTR